MAVPRLSLRRGWAGQESLHLSSLTSLPLRQRGRPLARSLRSDSHVFSTDFQFFGPRGPQFHKASPAFILMTKQVLRLELTLSRTADPSARGPEHSRAGGVLDDYLQLWHDREGDDAFHRVRARRRRAEPVREPKASHKTRPAQTLLRRGRACARRTCELPKKARGSPGELAPATASPAALRLYIV